MRASGSTEPEASVNRTRVIRWCLATIAPKAESRVSRNDNLYFVRRSIALRIHRAQHEPIKAGAIQAICPLADSSLKSRRDRNRAAPRSWKREPDLHDNDEVNKFLKSKEHRHRSVRCQITELLEF